MTVSASLDYRVPYADTDQMTFVYYANYLIYFEMAREDCPGISREASHAAFAHEGFRYLEDYKLRCRDIRTEGRAVIVDESELPPL